jgi:hypothetical protein
MTNKALNFWNTLPTWAKGVLAVGGAAAAYFAVKGFLNKLKEQAAMQNAIQTQKNQENELQNLIKNNIKPSFADSQYKQWADELQNQFDGCDFSVRIPVSPKIVWNSNWSSSGAKLATIVLEFKNDADFLALSTAWGSSRTYDQCGWNPLGDGNFNGNLSQAITDELAQYEINAINDYLSKQGIKYRF